MRVNDKKTFRGITSTNMLLVTTTKSCNICEQTYATKEKLSLPTRTSFLGCFSKTSFVKRVSKPASIKLIKKFKYFC